MESADFFHWDVFRSPILRQVKDIIYNVMWLCVGINHARVEHHEHLNFSASLGLSAWM